MTKAKRTTIEIAEAAKAAFQRMIARYGIRLSVSAGIILLDKLSPQDREAVIDEVVLSAKNQKTKPINNLPNQNLKDSVDNIGYFVKFKLLSPEEKQLLAQLQQTLTDQTSHKKRKQKARKA